MKDPLWLKEKGDEFMRNKDYVSAVTVYKSSFKLDATLARCLSNIGICHLAMFNPEECLKVT